MSPPLLKRKREISCRQCDGHDFKGNEFQSFCNHCRSSDGSLKILEGPEIQETIALLKQKISETKKALDRKYSDSEKCVNFYASYNSLSIKGGFIEDNKPFSEKALIQKDVFSCLFLVAVYYTFNPTKDMAKEYQENPRMLAAWKRGVCMDNQLNPSVMKTINRDNTEGNVASVLDEYAKDREKKAEFKKNFFPSMFNGMGKASVETNLDRLIELIESILPVPEVYDAYIDFFVENVQPYIQILNIEVFDEVRGMLQIENGRFKVVINGDLRKLIVIATILIVLRTSYTAWSVMQEVQFVEENPISVDLVSVALKCIGHVNVFKRSNEELLTCLMHLRLYFSFSPEENDFSMGSTSDILLTMTVNTAMHIGLQKDPSKISQFANDPKAKFLRRKLWFMVIVMARADAVIAGSFPLIGKEYMYKFKADLPEQEPAISIMNKHLEGLRLLAEMYIFTTKVHDTIKLTEIELLMNQAETFLADNYDTSLFTTGNSVDDFQANFTKFRMNTMMKTYFMTIYASLSVNFEFNENSADPVLFKKYYMKMLEASIDVSANCIHLLTGHYVPFLGGNGIHKYLFMKLVFLCSKRLCFVLISVIVRILQLLEENMYGYPEATRLSMISLVNKCFALTSHLRNLLKETLCHKQYTSLPTVVLVDYSLQSLKIRGFAFIEDFLKWTRVSNNPMTLTFTRMIKNKLGFDLSTASVEQLRKINLIGQLNAQELEGIEKLIDSKGFNLPDDYIFRPPPPPRDNSQQTLISCSHSWSSVSGGFSSGLSPLFTGTTESVPTKVSTDAFNPFESISFNEANTQIGPGADSELAALFEQTYADDFWAGLFEDTGLSGI